ncbi:MAG: oxidoreductase [Candidatus Korarchaeota archaeon]|nr:oxidoreductase [Candidatus Korarchaeota archaeon]NIU84505.1 oxidoreductase [Candidatus Thorarchaeota archaeon]NIW14572.1 oxidoreductase [Candidatus Thorarchaeota archaeon]NIW52644.1 oxidoreductase [Candidatus Korarchaeota archaeon]
MNKIKLAVGYGSICGGCDVAFTDVGVKLAEVSEIADIVYWPAVMDGKNAQLEKIPEIDIGMIFGAIRTEEHERMAKLLREKSDTLVAFGACACYGGIPGLGNVETKEKLLKAAYWETPSTETRVIPGFQEIEGGKITLTALKDYVSAPTDVVDFDVLVPGCPPPVESVEQLIETLKDYYKGHKIPKGFVIAEDKSLCEYCKREKPEKISLTEIKRVHEAEINDEECLLKQGILCLGPVTRGGCHPDGARCVEKNMPCRGCFGPIPNVRDPGTKFLSTIASAIMAEKEKEVGEEALQKFIDDNIFDPVGLFYRFALAVSIFNRKYLEEQER